MEHVFWLEPGRIAGRSGPNLDPWDVRELYAGGIRAVLSVNDGDMVVPEEFAAVGIEYARISLTRAAPPEPGDVERNLPRLAETAAWIDSQLAAGRPLMIHCRSGKDRTGLTMAYYLRTRRGLSAEAAFQAVRAVRAIAFTAEGWEEMAREVLERAPRA